MRKHLLVCTITGLLVMTVSACGAGTGTAMSAKTMTDQKSERMETSGAEQSSGMEMKESTQSGGTGMKDSTQSSSGTDMKDSAQVSGTGMKDSTQGGSTGMIDSTHGSSTGMIDSTQGSSTDMKESTQGSSTGMKDSTHGSTDNQMNQGTPAPDFEMTDLKGNTVRLSDYKGQKVYIKYWASWCPICLGGLEDINTLSGEDTGFQVLTIVAPGQKGEKSMEDFKTWFAGVDHTENIKVLFDTDGAYGTKTGVRGYPTSEYIGSDGVMVKLAPGHADNDTIINTFKDIK